MRRIRYAVAASLDGFIAGPQGEADWIVMDPEIDFGALVSRFDTLLMGRRTYAAMAGGGGGGGMFSGMRVIVASTTLVPAEHSRVTIIGADLAAAIEELRRAPGKDIWLFGGGGLFGSLLDLGLVDAVEVAVIPVLLGGGIRLLPEPARRTNLELVGHRAYPRTGTVLLEYAVGKPRGRARRATRGPVAKA